MPTAAGQKKPDVGNQSSVNYEHESAGIEANSKPGEGVFEAGLIDAINQIFSEFAFAYHNQYHKAFPDSGRDAVYYVRAIEEASPTINGGNLRATYGSDGQVKAVNPCYGDFRVDSEDDCQAPLGHRAWSSPIFVNHVSKP